MQILARLLAGAVLADPWRRVAERGRRPQAYLFPARLENIVGKFCCAATRSQLPELTFCHQLTGIRPLAKVCDDN